SIPGFTVAAGKLLAESSSTQREVRVEDNAVRRRAYRRRQGRQNLRRERGLRRRSGGVASRRHREGDRVVGDVPPQDRSRRQRGDGQAALFRQTANARPVAE